jgi:hypothetical protein
MNSGTKSVNEAKSALQGFGVDEVLLEPISDVLVNTVFREVTNVVRLHSLKGASVEDMKELFNVVRAFGLSREMRGIDQEFLKGGMMTVGESLIESFHGEYSSRLKNALAAEAWPCVE